MGALAACLTQTMVAHGTSKGIQLDSIKIRVEGDVDMRGFSGISNDVRPGARIKFSATNIFFLLRCRYQAQICELVQYKSITKNDDCQFEYSFIYDKCRNSSMFIIDLQ